MENEALIRLAVFAGLFMLFAALESVVPRRDRTQTRKARWTTNWAIIIIDTVTLRALAIFLPLLAVGAAYDAANNGWGFFNAVEWPAWLEVTLAILILDFAIWAQHLITHKVPLLWRLHQVHHADVDIDVTTAIRFHPVEIALSMLLKIGLVYLMGPAGVAVILFEIILNGTAMFNHANIKLPLWLDAIMRTVLVTPDMHRVHHSVHRTEHDSNYGFSLSIWDRMFRTYIAQPSEGHDEMKIGLRWQDDRPSKLTWSLALPFRNK
ncbi:Sterol desaturase/sphingolipid hydroxylase, fatty acid hydroxylase superfamily [Litoreibacter ascidiaceicola]|uniref:Sterol desaturase/sphingolipid hydroxylase, fatty acid hydroxylase superfamily n=1 Tax=Litoreibacter ascidiaceicola TaxID=1486859 RepID=A0A1M4XPB4_9RHOB|nr:sterol desaturase family protein [Litoreibacter ascidiaceicola]SHE95270.1 Sterol desaturase/sphingolipid hydroxylase, fatty acid hydroxylase superfamily [Litoreibacter ascidiaceicola]